MPVRIRTAPKTPKAGSTLVSSEMGGGDSLAEGDGEVEAVGVTVYVTLKVVGTVVVNGVFWPFLLVLVVIVVVPVVNESERLGVGLGVCPELCAVMSAAVLANTASKRSRMLSQERERNGWGMRVPVQEARGCFRLVASDHKASGFAKGANRPCVQQQQLMHQMRGISAF